MLEKFIGTTLLDQYLTQQVAHGEDGEGTRIQTRLMPSANRVNRAFAPSMYGIP